MEYFLPELNKRIAESVADIISVSTGDINIQQANEKFDADLAVPMFAFANEARRSPQELAKEVAQKLQLDKIEKVEAVSGFVNIRLKPTAMAESLENIDDWFAYGNNEAFGGQDVLIEHTDPNPFKQLHIGHVYSNTVGESLAKLHEAAGATVHRLSYHGDVGMHVAKAMWGISEKLDGKKLTEIDEAERADFLGQAYAQGAKAYEEDEQAKKQIEELNRKIYELSDPELKAAYEVARKWSFDYFDEVYARLGVMFEKKYFESDAAKVGMKLVEDNPDVFEKSDGATIFKGEDYGEHTRVFISSAGLPTYEAKDLGLIKLKHADYPEAALSVIITAQEQAAYFRVMLKAMEQIDGELAKKTKHLAHGEVRLPSGKMSSRTGDVITAVEVLDLVETAIKQRAPDSSAHRDNTLAAIKYAFLKQNIGGDIVFDIEESISLEGQTGPYVQYAAVRINSILRKVEAGDDWGEYDWQAERELLFMVSRYPDVVKEATIELQPHKIAQFLYDIARELNRYYENVNVKDAEDEARAARVFMLRAVRSVLRHGLNLLNITVPEKM